MNRKILEKILDGLNDEQKKAVQTLENVVTTAGAGSGKTTVIARRFAYLVESGVPVENIMTLTFTNKATAEMYSRIYRDLKALAEFERENGCNPRFASKAVAEFAKARITTLDACCTAIAKKAAFDFGIAPDFSSDAGALKIEMRKAAMQFAIRNRRSVSMSFLLSRHGIEDIADKIFVPLFTDHVSIVCPDDVFAKMLRSERNEISAAISSLKRDLENDFGDFEALLSDAKKNADDEKKLCRSAVQLLSALDAEFDKTEEWQNLFAVLEKIAKLNLSTFKSKFNDKDAAKSLLSKLRARRDSLEIILPFLQHGDVLDDFFLNILPDFQKKAKSLKRHKGILSFYDVAQMALAALRQNVELRQSEKRKTGKIMIDEFQDNNQMQRDLLFLLAEEVGRDGAKSFSSDENLAADSGFSLRGDALFFVGDEKQSIYKFRGADVSVFRSLEAMGDDGQCGFHPSVRLQNNYRSTKALVDAFNYFFGGFGCEKSGAGIFHFDENFEAKYEREVISMRGENDESEMHGVQFVLFENAEGNDGEKQNLPTADFEIAQVDWTVAKIKELVESGKYSWADVAILMRSTTKQPLFEQALQSQKIPMNLSKITNFWNYKLSTDFCNFLRLAVYPFDRMAFAATLTGDFAQFDEQTALLLVLKTGENPAFSPLPDIPPSIKARYEIVKTLYDEICRDSVRLTIADLVAKLWIEKGFCHNFCKSDGGDSAFATFIPAAVEHFDYLFELARQSDEKHETLSQFVDKMSLLRKNGDKLDDLDIPTESPDGVKIMSVHAAKGLEFPAVFVPFSEKKSKNQASGAIYIENDGRISLKLPMRDEVGGKNFFFERDKEKIKAEESAELRRLFYVAATRAKDGLFVIGKRPESSSSEKNAQSFCDLFAGRIADENSDFFKVIREKCALHAQEQAAKSETAAPDFAKMLDRAKENRLPQCRSKVFSPSRLEKEADFSNFSDGTQFVKIADGAFRQDFSSLNRILSNCQSGISARNFGTLVHAVIEKKFDASAAEKAMEILSALKPQDAKAVAAAAETMAAEFWKCGIGRRAAAADFCRSEYAFRFLFGGGSLSGKYLSGKIDLIFKDGGGITVVDFKTDEDEHCEIHAKQMKAYSLVAKSLFAEGRDETPVSAVIYYLRSGNQYRLQNVV